MRFHVDYHVQVERNDEIQFLGTIPNPDLSCWTPLGRALRIEDTTFVHILLRRNIDPKG